MKGFRHDLHAEILSAHRHVNFVSTIQVKCIPMRLFQNFEFCLPIWRSLREASILVEGHGAKMTIQLCSKNVSGKAADEARPCEFVVHGLKSVCCGTHCK